jgi:glutaredoxin
VLAFSKPASVPFSCLAWLVALFAAVSFGCDLGPKDAVGQRTKPFSSRAKQLSSGAESAREDAGAPASSREDIASLGPEAAKRVYYQFIDERQQVRFVDRLEDVPESWRDRVGFVELDYPPPMSPAAARLARQKQLARTSARVGPAAGRARAAAPTVILYYAEWCGWCRKARAHLDAKRVDYELRDIDIPAVLAELVEKTGQRGVPAIDVNGRILKGFDPVRLDKLLADLS